MSSFVRTLPLRHALGMGLALALAPVGCTPWRSSPSPADSRAAQTAFGTVSEGRISIREAADRPRVTTVVRQGDPAGAIAAVVLTGGDSAQSVALAAVIRERLRRAGIGDVDVAADRFGYRVRALVTTPLAAQTFVRALREALDRPIGPSSPVMKKVGEALVALRHRPLDGPELVPVADCTGELGEPASATTIDPTSPAGASRVEQWRRQFHGAQRIALAVVGPSSFGTAVEKHLAGDSSWASVDAPTDPWPERDAVTAYPLAGSNTDSPRLTVAARVGSTFAVSQLAENVFHAEGPLAQRLAASTSWRLARTTATVRPRGACLAITVQRDAARKDADLGNDAARIAAMITHDVKVEVDAAKVGAAVAGERVLQASDPRDAASLAAWWSHAARLEPRETRLAVALGIPPKESSPKDENVDGHVQTIRDRLVTALPRLATTWKRPVIEAATRVENGQGNFWVLLASPCGTSAETEVDAGFTALASVAAARAANGIDDVAIEPWIAQDGVGVLAHATPGINESPADLARRVSNAAGRAMLGLPPPPHLVTASRARLLALMEAPSGPHSEPFGSLARALEPRHPAWLSPFGLRKAIVEGDVRSIELRRSAMSDGPLRVAVLANEDADQASLAVATVDRWIVQRGSSPRACPPVGASAPESSEARDLVIHSVERPPHVLLGIAVKKPTPGDVQMLELLREALVGNDGWLSQSFRSFAGPVRVDARIVGQQHVRALVVEIHCADELLDRAVEQARAVFDRLRRGAATGEHLRRAHDRVEHLRMERALEPRHRLAAAWRSETAPPAAPSIASWRSWLARVLRDDAVAIVRVRPPKSEPDDGK